MKTRLIFLLFTIYFTTTLHAGIEDNNKILISKIKFIIDGETIVWRDGTSIPENPDDNGSQPAYLSTFFSYVPGDEVTLKELEKEVVRAGHRLNQSGLFYNPSISIVPPRLYPYKRTIIINITDGFRMRFGGGEAFGQFGIMNIGGKGHSVIATAGANINEVKYRNDTSIPGDFFWGFNLGYYNSLFNEYYKELSHTVKIGSFLGYRVNPDLDISLGIAANYFSSGDRGDDQLILYLLEPSIKYEAFSKFSESFDMNYGISCEMGLSPAVDKVNFSVEATGFSRSLISNLFGISFRVSSGFRDDDGSGVKFNLYNDSERSIRSGFSVKELHTSEYLLMNSEAGIHFPRAVIPPIFNIDTSLFVFNDLGQIHGEILDATGFGAGLFFDNPIFAGFVFTYGWNRMGQGRFLFTATIEL